MATARIRNSRRICLLKHVLLGFLKESADCFRMIQRGHFVACLPQWHALRLGPAGCSSDDQEPALSFQSAGSRPHNQRGSVKGAGTELDTVPGTYHQSRVNRTKSVIA